MIIRQHLSCFLSRQELQFLEFINGHPRLIPRRSTWKTSTSDRFNDQEVGLRLAEDDPRTEYSIPVWKKYYNSTRTNEPICHIMSFITEL